MEQKREINAVDSLKCFFYSIAMPILFSVFYEVIIIVLSFIFKIDYEVFSNHWLVQGLKYILNSVVFIFIVYVFMKRNKLSFQDNINIKKNYNMWTFFIIIILAFVLVLGSTNFINLVDFVYAKLGYSPSGDLPLPINTLGNMFISIVLWAMLPAIAEELLFRGIIFKGLTTKFKPSVAIILGGLFFMLMHGSLQQTVYQFILGVVLCVVYYFSKNIIYPIILHFLNNAIVIFFNYLQNVDSLSITTSFHTAWSIIWPILIMVCTAAATVGLVYAIRFVNKDKYNQFTKNINNEQPKQEYVFWMIISLSFAIILWLTDTITTWIGL